MIASALLLLLILLALYVGSHKLTGSQTLIALAVFSCGVALLIFPNFAEQLAALLNVGRGADVIIYFAIVSGMFISANFYFRFKRDEQQVIALVRALALLSADLSNASTSRIERDGSAVIPDDSGQ
jgi:small membrane protein